MAVAAVPGDFSLPAVLSHAFDLYRRHLVAFAAVLAVNTIVAWGPVLALAVAGLLAFIAVYPLAPSLLMDAVQEEGEVILNARGSGLVMVGVVLSLSWLLLIDAWFQNVLASMTASTLDGGRTNIRTSLRVGWQRLGATLTAKLLLYAAVLIGAATLVALLVLLGPAAPCLVLPASLVVLVAYAYFSVSFTFYVQAAVLRHENGGQALRSSFALVRPMWWQIFGATLLLAALVGLVAAALALATGIVDAIFENIPGVAATIAWIGFDIAAFVIGLLPLGYQSVAITVLYRELAPSETAAAHPA